MRYCERNIKTRHIITLQTRQSLCSKSEECDLIVDSRTRSSLLPCSTVAKLSEATIPLSFRSYFLPCIP
jgi:hypothetical protein